MIHGFWPIFAQLNRLNLAYFIRLLSQAQYKAQIIHCHQQPPPSAASSRHSLPPAATFRSNSGEFSGKLKKKKKKEFLSFFQTQGYTLS
jgi:hypothetical protein